MDSVGRNFLKKVSPHTPLQKLSDDKKTKKSKGAQIVENNSNNTTQSTASAQQPNNAQTTQNAQTGQPQYFRVKQNPNYVMAEFPDRYELYRLSGGNMIKVRTDYK
jgi:hypothetical protein